MRGHEREAYDDMLDAGDDRVPCNICRGDEGAEPCSEECEEIAIRAVRVRLIRRFYQGARDALVLARRYQDESVSGDHRITECLQMVRVHRTRIRVARALNAESLARMSGELAEAAE